MDHLIELGSAMSRFTELTDASYGTEVVPSCPGWTMHDLAAHLGTIHRWAGAIVLSGQRLDEPATRPVEPIADWYAGVATALLEVLQAVPAGEETPNFAHIDERAAFWVRRQMHETTIHTIDASQALGLGEDGWKISPDLAADGVSEVVGVFFPRMTVRGQRPDLRGRVRLRATDIDQTWIVHPADDAYGTPLRQYDDGSAAVDGEISGTALELYLGLWHRIPTSRLRTDSQIAAALLTGPTVP